MNKKERRELVVLCIELAIKTIIAGVVVFGTLWLAGFITAHAAPVMENVLWNAYHAIMG